MIRIQNRPPPSFRNSNALNAVYWLTLSLLFVACERNRVQGRVGEVLIVGPDETLALEKVLNVPAVAMSDTGTSELHLRNVGNGIATVTKVTQLAGRATFQIQLPNSLILEPSSDIALPVVFSPDQTRDVSLERETHRAIFEIEVAGTLEEASKLRVSLAADALARDCFVPKIVDFKAVPVGRRVELPLLLSNGSSREALTTFGPIEGSALFSLAPSHEIMVPTKSMARAQVSFGPFDESASEARVVIQRSAWCAPGVTLLRGRGSLKAVTWSPADLTFGRIPLGSAQQQKVTVVNQTGAELAFTSLAVFGPGFRLTSGAPAAAKADGTTDIGIECAPTSLGLLEGELRFVIDTTPPLEASVLLRCTGGGPKIRVAPSPLNYGQIPFVAGLGPATHRKVNIYNIGTPPRNVADVSSHLVLGRNGALPFVSVLPLSENSSRDELRVLLPSSYSALGFAATPGKNSVALDFALSPKTLGLKEFEVTIYSNDALNPAVKVRLSALAVKAEPCTLETSPAVLNLGDHPKGTTTQGAISIRNKGNARCLVSGIDFTPESADAFRVIDPIQESFLVEPSQTRLITVEAAISATEAQGTRLNGILHFSTAGGQVLTPVTVRATGCLVVNPNELNFGTVKVGCRSAPRPINLYNVCNAPVLLDALFTSGEFALQSAPIIPQRFGLALLSGSTPTSLQLVFTPDSGVGAAADGGVSSAAGSLQIAYRETGVVAQSSVSLLGTPSSARFSSETFLQPRQTQADILFVIDDSCSMQDKQVALAKNLSIFFEALRSDNLDFQLGVTTTDGFSVQGRLKATPSNPIFLNAGTPNLEAKFAEKVNVGTLGSGFEQAFAGALDAVSDPNRSNANLGFLRTDAVLSVVLVTDAPEQSLQPTDFYVDGLRAAKGNRRAMVQVSTVSPTNTMAPAGCLIEGLDNGRFAEIARVTNGVATDICRANWAQDLGSIAKGLTATRKRFALKSIPENQSGISVVVDGQPSTNWTWDSATNSIVFQGEPAAGSQISVSFQTACF
jgi:hypothetical protein